MAKSAGTAAATTPVAQLPGDDPLLGCLLQAARHFGRPMARETLLSQLAWAGGALTPKLFVDGAQVLGLKATVRPIGWRRLLADGLPAVAVLQDGSAVLLVGTESGGQVALYRAVEQTAREQVGADELGRRYGGYAITLAADPEAADPAAATDGFGTAAEPDRRGWFWPVLARNASDSATDCRPTPR